MSTTKLQLSAIKMLSELDSHKNAKMATQIWVYINNLVNSEKHQEEEWTEEEEREAFLYTSKVNAAKMFAKYL